MKDIEVKISKETRMVYLEKNKNFAGLDGENLQGNFVFSFNDEFVDGIARMEFAINGQKKYAFPIKDGETYKIPIKSVLTKKGNILVQLVITEKGDYVLTEDDKYKDNKIYFVLENELFRALEKGVDYEVGDDITGEVYECINIPIFKSNIFYVYVNESINAEIEAEDEYYAWIDIANQKLIEIDEAIEEANNLNVEIERVEGGIEITLTKKDGTAKTETVYDGERGEKGDPGERGEPGQQGQPGQDAKINGVNTLNIVAGENVNLEQQGETLTINATDTIYDDTEIKEDIEDISNEIDNINELIPNQATSTNKLADKAFVNSTVQTTTANFRGNWTTWANVPVNAEDYPSDYAGIKTPSTNDYMVVQNASDYVDPQKTLTGTWRFKYSGVWETVGKNGWRPEYQVNETPMTAQQLASLNSGATENLINQISENERLIYDLQNDKVGFTDYPTSEKGGVIKINGYGVQAPAGQLIGLGRTYQEYISAANQLLIAKQTLENVFTGKNIETANNKTTTISSSSTNTQYPGAKAVYDYIESLDIEEVSF